VAGELLRAAGGALLAPARTAIFLARARALRRDLLADLDQPRAVEDAPPPSELPARALRFFVSSAEPSGERHAVHLIESLRAELAALGAPAPEFLALGGERTRRLGVETVGDPLERAAMGAEPLRSLPFYARLLARTSERLSAFRPDAVIPVDSPALHVPLARLAKGRGARTLHLVAPQYWGWAPWRVRAYREAVERVLAILPFEPSWFARHGVPATFIGHPELDGLAPAPPMSSPERRTLVLLPGSRPGVVQRNLPWMLECARRLRARIHGLEALVANDRSELRGPIERELVRAGAGRWVRLSLGSLQTELSRARVALSVSGTILIDLLHQRLPAAVVYRLDSRLAAFSARHMLTVPWFSSVNLLARQEVYREACFRGGGPLEDVLVFLQRAWSEPEFRAGIRSGLDEAALRLGPPGAIRRAARHGILFAAGGGP
jgi:lipid-A-disaccharide synthase